MWNLNLKPERRNLNLEREKTALAGNLLILFPEYEYSVALDDGAAVLYRLQMYSIAISFRHRLKPESERPGNRLRAKHVRYRLPRIRAENEQKQAAGGFADAAVLWLLCHCCGCCRSSLEWLVLRVQLPKQQGSVYKTQSGYTNTFGCQILYTMRNLDPEEPAFLRTYNMKKS